MILDASAVIAILRQEPEAADFARAIEKAPSRRISAVNYVEAAIVIDAEKDAIASRRFDDLIQKAGVEVSEVTAKHAQVAREAYRQFGRGCGHPAKLNFGDCFAYALAVTSGERLL